MIGTSHDITERKLAEEVIARREAQMRLITDNVPGLISYVDSQRRFQFVNARYFDLFGITPGEAAGRHVRDVLGEELLERVEAPLAEALLLVADLEVLLHVAKENRGLVQAPDGAVPVANGVGDSSHLADRKPMDQGGVDDGGSFHRLHRASCPLHDACGVGPGAGAGRTGDERNHLGGGCDLYG